MDVFHWGGCCCLERVSQGMNLPPQVGRFFPGRLHMTLIYSTIVKVCNRTGVVLSTARSQTLRYPLKMGGDFSICVYPDLPSRAIAYGNQTHSFFCSRWVDSPIGRGIQGSWCSPSSGETINFSLLNAICNRPEILPRWGCHPPS